LLHAEINVLGAEARLNMRVPTVPLKVDVQLRAADVFLVLGSEPFLL
jgi:hypothetical protein